jgi:hypothetical protein
MSSGMLRRVILVRTAFLEEDITPIIRVTRIGEVGITLEVTSNRRMLRRNNVLLVTANVILSSLILVTLMMEAIHSSESLVLTRATRHNIPEGVIFLRVSCSICSITHAKYDSPLPSI